MRFQKQAAFMRDEAADVYCLQEVFSEAVIRELEKELGAQYVVLRGQTGHAHVPFKYVAQCAVILLFVASAAFVAWSCSAWSRSSLLASALVAGIALLAFWRSARRRVLWAFVCGSTPGGLLLLCRRETVQVRRASFQPFDAQGGDFMNLVRRRGYLSSKLLIRGSPVTLVNAHTNAFPSVSLRNAKPLPSVDRALQLRQACHEAACIDKDESFIVAGDFNTEPDDGEIPAAAYGLVNSWNRDDSYYVTIPLTAMLTQVFPETPHGLCSDYQFSKGLAVHHAKVLQTGDLSDHLPVKIVYQHTSK